MRRPDRKGFVQATQWYRVRRAHRVAVSAYLDGSTAHSRPDEPVIIVGMHRSGTSITARVLDTLGVDVGADVTRETHESIAYRARNSALLAAAGASWDQPAPFVGALADPDWRRAFSATLESMVESPARWLLYDPHGSSGDRPDRWGWKDPRTSITWPLWLDLYPGARFVRVRRNVDEVVASLVARSRRGLAAGSRHSIRATTESEAIALVAEYEDALDRLDDAVAPDRIVEVFYQDLTAEPCATVGRLAAELGLDAARVDEAAALVRPR